MQSTTKPCAYFLGYTVHVHAWGSWNKSYTVLRICVICRWECSFEIMRQRKTWWHHNKWTYIGFAIHQRWRRWFSRFLRNLPNSNASWVWWRREVDMLPVSLALCERKPPVTDGSLTNGQLCGDLMFSLLIAWASGWTNRRIAGGGWTLMWCHCNGVIKHSLFYSFRSDDLSIRKHSRSIRHITFIVIWVHWCVMCHMDLNVLTYTHKTILGLFFVKCVIL